MIFYFSGTGNSLQIAKNIAEHNDEKLISIAFEMNNSENNLEYTLKDSEVVGFVYPVYAWAPPKMVTNFIAKLKLNNYKDNYIFTVATCGANIGNTMKVISSSLMKKNYKLSSGFSVIMPSNYISGGFVDSKEIAQKKLSESENVLKNINQIIKEKKDNIFQVTKGSIPVILTNVINPLFNKFANNTKKFYANDSCSGCGICECICSCKNIKVDVKPKWGKECALCLGCINLCPVNAIQYGKSTEHKERYKNPNVTLNEMKINR